MAAPDAGLWNGIMSKLASHMSRHFLALWFPRLPTDRLRRDDPRYAKADMALVVADRIANALRLTAVDTTAAKLGLAPGMALTDARARVENLDVAVAQPTSDVALIERLADWCHRYTPLVALDLPHGIMLDITGCDHLFGGLAAMQQDVLARLTRSGLMVRAAIAPNAANARLLARFSSGGIFDAAKILATVPALPIAALEVEASIETGLKRAGLYRISDVKTVPRAALTARFGPALVEKLDQLDERASRPISPRRLIPLCTVEQRLTEPIMSMELVEALMPDLSARLFHQLTQSGEGALVVEAAFFRVDGYMRPIIIETGQALSDKAIFLRLLRERLAVLTDPLDLGYGFDLIRLSALRCERVIHRQVSLDQTETNSAQINVLIDRLSARMGHTRIMRSVPRNTHIPERAFAYYPAIRPIAPVQIDYETTRQVNEPPTRPIRLFQPPQPIETTADLPDGPPAQFRWRRVLHRVRLSEGPERISAEWWRNLEAEQPEHPRDYYRVEDENGRRFWIFREGLYEEITSPRWFLHGLFA